MSASVTVVLFGVQSAEGAVQLFKDQVFGASHNDEEEAAAQRNSEKKGAKRKADTVDSLCETSVNWKQHVTAGTVNAVMRFIMLML